MLPWAKIRAAAVASGRASLVHKATTSFNLEMNTLAFDDQTVYAGTEALESFVESLHQASAKRPLLVTDEGVAKLSLIEDIKQSMAAKGMEPAIFDKCVPNPGVSDVVGIAEAFLKHECDSAVGVGGGGPLDAAKGGMALVAEHEALQGFEIARDAPDFIKNKCRQFSKHVEENPGLVDLIPLVAAIPTTAGTGSDGGKSAVISDESGTKVVFGHPKLMPAYAALVPQFTTGLPARLTSATGVDAMFHSLEAYLVPTDIMIERDGMTMEEINRCDDFATKGIQLVVRHLRKALDDPSDLEARLGMQIAALYGAKAFRKGDLGGVHASAHALGAMFHTHHGEAIGRMAVPVLAHSEAQPHYPEDAQKRSAALADVILDASESKSSASEPKKLSGVVEDFLGQFKASGVAVGAADLLSSDSAEAESQIRELARLAAADGCQTNPVALSEEDYLGVFQRARGM